MHYSDTLLGRIRLLPIEPQIGQPCYQAEAALRVLDLIEAPGEAEGPAALSRCGSRWVDAIATNSNDRRNAPHFLTPSY